MNCTISFARISGAVNRCLADNRLGLEGQASQKGKHLGVKFAAVLNVQTDGSCLPDTDRLHIQDAREIILTLAAESDYNVDAPYEPRQDKLLALAGDRVAESAAKSYSELYEAHLADHQALYNRLSLDLGDAKADQPTDLRIADYKAGAEDPGLEALQFQYGRYLLITSSRPGSLPANLQGVWNDRMEAPWNSDYHTNINLQMNYWLAEQANLSDCHLPLFDFLEKLGKHLQHGFFHQRRILQVAWAAAVLSWGMLRMSGNLPRFLASPVMACG